MSKLKKTVVLHGNKKGGGGSAGRAAQEADNTLRSKSYARVLDLISEGEIEGLVNDAKSIYLNETPLQNADGSMNFDCAVEFRNGTQGQDYIAGFDAVENEVGVSAKVKYGAPVVRSVTNPNIDAINLKIRLPALTHQDTGTGDLNGSEAGIKIELESGNSGVFSTIIEDRIAGKTTSAYERAYRFPLMGEAPWQIRVSRTTADSTKSNVSNDTYVSSFTEIIESKLNYPNSAIAALVVDSEAFDSIPARAYHVRLLRVRVPSNYNPLTRTYEGTWDGTFKIAWTNNPAWCLYDIIESDRYGLGDLIPTGTMDKWTLYTIGKYCDEQVSDGRGGMEPRYTLNCYMQSRENAYEVLRNMASAFAGMLYMSSGSIFAVQDRPADPEYLFTNSNVKNGEFVYQGSSATARHTVALVTWNDLKDFGRTKVEYVEDPEGIRRYGVIETEVVAYGCTSRGQAHRFGRSILASEQMLTETISFTTGIEGNAITPGMVIKVRDDLRHGQRLAGRILAINTRGDGKQVLKIDAPVKLTAGEKHQIELMAPGAMLKTKCQWVNGTAQDELLLDDVVPTAGDEAIPVGAVWGLTIEQDDAPVDLFRVVSAAEVDGEFVISGLQYNDAKYRYAENLDISDSMQDVFDKDAALTSDAPTAPAGVEVSIVNASRDSVTYIGNLDVSWMAAPGITRWQVELKREGENPEIRSVSGQPSTTFAGLKEGNYVVRVRAVNFKGTPSVWASSETLRLGFDEFTVVQIGAGSAAVNPFSSIRIGDGFLSVILEWTLNPAISDQVHTIEVWSKQGDPNALDFGEKFKKIATLPSISTGYTHQDLAPGAERLYMLRVKDRRGIYSEFCPWDRTLKGKSSVDVTNMLNALENSFKATDFFGGIITEIEKISDLSELIASSDITELKQLANVINVDLGMLREEVRKVGWNLERDSELILRSVVLTEEARNHATKAVAKMTTEYLKLEEGLATGIGRLESLIAEQIGGTGQSLSARIDEETRVRVSKDDAMSVRIEQLASSYKTQKDELLALLLSETQTRTSAIEALSKRVDTVYAELRGVDTDNLAKIKAEETARVTADTALANTVTTLAGVVESNDRSVRAAIQSESLASSTRDDALTKLVTTAQSEIKQNKTDVLAIIATESNTRATADSALTKLVTTAQSEIKQNKTDVLAIIATESNTRATADSALTSSINAVRADLSSESAALRSLVQNENIARVSFQEAVTLIINASSTAFETGDSILASRIQTEEQNRATADSALSLRINNLTSTVTSNDTAVKSLIQTESKTRATADSANATAISNLTTTVKNNDTAVKSLIQTESQSRATAIESTNKTINAMTSRLDTFTTTGRPASSVEAVLASEQRTRATADETLTKSIASMVSRFNTFDATGKEATSVEARLAKEESTRATADSANATKITQLTARLDKVGGGSVTMEQSFSATASKVSGLEGKYTIKVNNKGHVSGFGLASVANDGAVTSTFAVAADRFVIATPSGSSLTATSTPFQVVTTATTINGQAINPGIYMNDAYIRNGTITSAKIGDLQVDTLKIKDQAVTQAIYHQFSGSLTSGDTGWLGDARIMTGAINTGGTGTSSGTFKIVMTASFLLEPVGDVARYKGANMRQRADIIRISPTGTETVVRSGLVIGYSRAFSTALYAYGMGSVVLTYVDTVNNSSAGRYQYAIRVYGEGGNLLGFRVSNRAMMLQEIKK